MTRNGWILVTGATGRLGTAIVNDLLAQKNFRKRIRVLVRDPIKAKRLFGNRVQVVSHDLSSSDFIGLTEACQHVDRLIHLAALIDYGAPETRHWTVNYKGTLQLIRAAELKGVRRFVFLSSTSVYRGIKSPRGKRIDERTPFQPVSPYGRSKRASETALKESHLDYVILRPPIIYGEGFTSGFEFMVRMLRKGQLRTIGSGENAIPLIFVDDVVQAIRRALMLKKGREDFIITSGETHTQKQLFSELATAFGASPPTKHISRSAAFILFAGFRFRDRLLGRKQRFYNAYLHTLTEDRRYDISKAKRVLGFRPRILLHEGMARFVRYILREIPRGRDSKRSKI
ncbi:NAD-dependent epimerase/dehydratase family protein [Candidatus Micrarchaeota archaeon]|nr:NAD-dependent epimerase/dehydratase family protein [Candidatus Micrarchaeota archaeon]